jgi:hypothetical protein
MNLEKLLETIPEKDRDIVKKSASGSSIRKIASDLNLTKDKVWRTIKKYGGNGRDSLLHTLLTVTIARYYSQQGYDIVFETILGDTTSTAIDSFMVADVLATKNGSQVTIQCETTKTQKTSMKLPDSLMNQDIDYVIAIPMNSSKRAIDRYSKWTNTLLLVDVFNQNVRQYGATNEGMSVADKMDLVAIPINDQAKTPYEIVPSTEAGLLLDFAQLVFEFADAKRVKELRLIDSGRFMMDMLVQFVNYRKELAEELLKRGILQKGTRGGYTLTRTASE